MSPVTPGSLTSRLLEENPQLLDEIVAEHLLNKRRAEMANVKEPTDANIIENPNLNKRIEFPKMVYHHGERKAVIVGSHKEHQALGADWQEKPFPPQYDEPEKAALGDRMANLEARNQELQELVLTLVQKHSEQSDTIAKLLEKRK